MLLNNALASFGKLKKHLLKLHLDDLLDITLI